MYILKRILYTIIILLAVATVKAQYFSTGQDAAGINWKEINTENFRIIFPEEYAQKANYLANILENARPLVADDPDIKPVRIPVILHTHASYSNAYVAWAPKRTEFYVTPPQDIYPQQWLQQLALHEYRHVVQVTSVRTGLTKVLSYIFGEQATVGAVGVFVPFWFIEGDAVCSETALSESGRGRYPDFIMPLKAQVLDKGIYHYDKAVFGSYKDFVPDHYVLGYHLVAKGRMKYGEEMWKHTLDKTGRKSWMITPFNSAIKDYTGSGKVAFYKDIMHELKQQWDSIQQMIPVYEFSKLPHEERKDFTSYRFPHILPGDSLICLRNSIDDITRIIYINEEGEEKIIKTPGFIIPDAMAIAANKICWVEQIPDTRWDNRIFSVLKTYDLKTGETRTLTKRTHLYAPALSSDGSRICASSIHPDGKYSLKIYDAETGELLSEISTKDNLLFLKPSFAKDNKSIVSVVLGREGKSIVYISEETQEIDQLLPFTKAEISDATMAGDIVYFTGAYAGISNIYAFNIDDKQLLRLTNSEFGVADISITENGNYLVYSEYTAGGYKPVRMRIDPETWVQADGKMQYSLRLYEGISKINETQLAEDIPDRQYEIKNFSRLKNLFNFHSWAPVYINADNETFNPGVSVMSQNLLSTAFLTAGYEYDLNEETGKYILDFSYHGFYPVIDLRFNHGRRRSTFFNDSLHTYQDYSWIESGLRTGVYLPLNLTRSKYRFFIRPSAYLHMRFFNEDKSAERTIHTTSLKTMEYRLTASRSLKTSARDLNPKWGQVLIFNYKHAPFSREINDYIMSGESILYFPGFVRHHSIRFYLGAQERQREDYAFSNIVSIPRGYNSIFEDELYSFKADYALPLFYPDWSLGPVFYLKRLKTSLFYDYAETSTDNNIKVYRSTGVELSADMHVFRFLAPIEIGLRTSYLPDRQDVVFDLLFAIDFYGFY